MFTCASLSLPLPVLLPAAMSARSLVAFRADSYQAFENVGFFNHSYSLVHGVAVCYKGARQDWLLVLAPPVAIPLLPPDYSDYVGWFVDIELRIDDRLCEYVVSYDPLGWWGKPSGLAQFA